MASDSVALARQSALLLLVASAAAAGVYLFFQTAPDAKLCVSPFLSGSSPPVSR